MFETLNTNPDRPEDRMVTVFLNRSCPRKCYQCGIADNSRPAMSTENWKQALTNLHRAFKVTFFLFLGVEPLVLGQGFVDLVAHCRALGVAAGWYTTSPEPLFTRWRQALVDAGLENWSSGVDTLPHHPPLDPETDKKSREAIIGLQWMAARGVPTHVTTTIHKKNLEFIPEIAEWCYQNIPGVEYAINFVEWRKSTEFDFFSPPEDMKDMLWEGTAVEAYKVASIMESLKKVVKVPGRRFHTYEAYLDRAYSFYNTIDMHCLGAIGPAVDADGTMRLCGYHTGTAVKHHNALDLTNDAEVDAFRSNWERDLAKCSGCYWACFRLPQGDMRHHSHPDNSADRSKLLQIKGGLRA